MHKLFFNIKTWFEFNIIYFANDVKLLRSMMKGSLCVDRKTNANSIDYYYDHTRPPEFSSMNLKLYRLLVSNSDRYTLQRYLEILKNLEYCKELESHWSKDSYLYKNKDYLDKQIEYYKWIIKEFCDEGN